MKEKLKILAKWFWGEDIKIWDFQDTFIEVDVNKKRITFQPLTYPGQMDGLIEKMILEIYEKTSGVVSLSITFDGRRYICRVTSDAVRICDIGKNVSIERAKFDLLFNYIDSLCKRSMFADFEAMMDVYRSGKSDSFIFEWALKIRASSLN